MSTNGFEVPVRVQRRRVKGWRMPEHTKAVDRSTPYGNHVGIASVVGNHEAVRLYRAWVYADTQEGRNIREWLIKDLKGWDLACWCSLYQPCHADVLLELVNQAAP